MCLQKSLEFRTLKNFHFKDQSTFEPTFCAKVEKKVHVGATTFCFGSKFQFNNPNKDMHEVTHEFFNKSYLF